LQKEVIQLHELPITRSLLDIVKTKAAEINARKVSSVKVVIGELSGVEKDCLAFYFDILKKEYGLDDITLVVDVVPSQVSCRDCNKKFAPVDLPWRCPDCSGLNLAIQNGDECYVESMEVD
jgi:hydrogenase nickel incorporation protein HypA/HybF